MKRIAAKYLFPLENSEPVLNGFVEVEDDGTVIRTGVCDNPSAEENFLDGVLAPGLVNTHCHIELSYMWKLFRKGTGMAGFIDQINALRDTSPLEEKLADIQHWMDHLWQQGVSAMGDISNCDDSFAIKAASSMYTRTFLEVFGTEPEDCASVIEGVLKLKEKADACGLDAAPTPHSCYTMSPELVTASSAEGLKSGFLSFHSEETEEEEEMLKSGSGRMWENRKAAGMSTPPVTGKSSLLYFIDRLEKAHPAPFDEHILLVHEVCMDQEGMDAVKKAVREMAYAIQNNIQRAERGLGEQEKMGMHIILTGNPGTGKTTIARKLGEILAAIGYLDSGHVVEVDRAQMVSQYQGETPKVVDRLCNKALGGILFVDEAYTLAPVSQGGERDNQGAQVLEKLMKRMEDDRGRFVVIAAGYRTEMENLFRINPGFRSRFNYFLDIDDYTPEQLLQIMLLFAQEKKYVFEPKAEELTRKMITELYNSRDKDFANGRTMRQLFDKICSKQAERLQKVTISTMTNEELMTITVDDIPYEAPQAVDYTQCLTKLDGLVGLSAVKKEISNLSAYLNLQIKRGEQNTFSGKHYVFTGNPGTGKTTVARIMANVFRSLGIVSRGQLVEADRSKLVAGYSGQTAIKTNQLIDTALGGVLFIDEAYTLKSNDNDAFGNEAIDTLLKRLEDDRGKFICIVAGYTDQMHDFIDSNPGLKSRFTQTIHFDDYTPDELTEIFLNLAKGKNFTVDQETQGAIHRQFEQLYLRRDKNFGNAREARRIFDETVEKQSQRLIGEINSPQFNEADMYRITTADLPMAQSETARPLDEVLNELDDFVGMRSVKNMIRRLAVQSMFMKQRAAIGAGKVQQLSMNFILTGNPGTGKTSVARKMGEVLQSMEILPTSRVIEASRATLVGKYMGETPKIVNNMCDKAMGGVLFIDEAYTLSAENDQYGKEAIDTLMKRMEDDRGKFVVIAAGYKNKMDEFLAVNTGLASRFTHKLHIDDYNEDELLAIFKKMAAKEQYTLSPGAEFKLMDLICRKVVTRDESFGNAREMRNMLDATIQQLSMRVAAMPRSEITPETYQIIEPEDIKFDEL